MILKYLTIWSTDHLIIWLSAHLIIWLSDDHIIWLSYYLTLNSANSPGCEPSLHLQLAVIKYLQDQGKVWSLETTRDLWCLSTLGDKLCFKTQTCNQEYGSAILLRVPWSLSPFPLWFSCLCLKSHLFWTYVHAQCPMPRTFLSSRRIVFLA